MTLLKRIGYYLGGFSIGLVLLAFFLSGKKTSCDYSPSSRVKKNIRIKKIEYAEAASEIMSLNALDTSSITYLLNKGSVNFSESNTKLDSCKVYIIEGNHNNKELRLSIENCDSIATIISIGIKKGSD